MSSAEGMSREQILAFIQRMIALAENNPNEHEAELAAAKAAEWMARYNIRMADVEQHTETNFEERDIFTGKTGLLFDTICGIIEEFYFVKPYYCTGKIRNKRIIRFFGSAENIEIAAYVFKFLEETFKALWQRRYTEAKYFGEEEIPLSAKQSYFHGLGTGLRDKLRTERKAKFGDDSNRNALVVVSNQLQKAFREANPNLKNGDARNMQYNAQAANLGRKDGAAINVRTAVKGTQSAKQIR